MSEAYPKSITEIIDWDKKAPLNLCSTPGFEFVTYWNREAVEVIVRRALRAAGERVLSLKVDGVHPDQLHLKELRDQTLEEAQKAIEGMLM